MGGSGDLALQKEREAERRKAHLGNGRGLFPGLPGNRGTRQRLSASRRGVVGLVRASGDVAHGDFAPPPVPVQPASVADPVSGAGRIPRHSRERRATLAPRPQAPHPAPRYKRPGNAPHVGRDGKECTVVGIFVKRGED
jgi:hypothetical protein